MRRTTITSAGVAGGDNAKRSDIMREKNWYSPFVLAFLLLVVWVVPAGADVFIQCPCLQPGADGKPDPTHPIVAPFTDTAGNVFTSSAVYNVATGNIECSYTDPASVIHNVACRSLAAGDGHINMPDGLDLFVFGFHDVTGVATDQINGMATDGPDSTTTPTFCLPARAALGSCTKGMRGMEGPAPTLVMKEGQEFYLSLTNVSLVERPDLVDPHTIHYHGFPNAANIFDGEPMASVAITMGNTFTYFYNNVEPGTYMYHCHVEASEHMQMGMLGNLYVDPAQNGTNPGGCTCPSQLYAYNDGDCSTCYDKVYPILEEGFDPIFHDADHTYNKLDFQHMRDTYMAFNGRGYPDTINPCPGPGCTAPIINSLGLQSQNVTTRITATAGQKILLRIASLATVEFSTVRVLGIPMRVVGMGARLLRGPGGKTTSYTTNSITLGGGESMDVILDTTGVAPGTYFMYTTNLNNLSNNDEDFGGMMTEILVN
jgi:hypothetical protein